jgi:NAD(P)-dependent dehydrogenase (short-subunit alcohol dehydrogenase family)
MLFDQVDERLGEPDIVVYNASARAHGPIAEIDPAAVEKAVAISALGGFYVTQQAAKRMTPHGRGAILLTGASASVKGFPLSSAFAMGKFAWSPTAGPGRQARQHARSGCDCSDLYRRIAPASERVVARG